MNDLTNANRLVLQVELEPVSGKIFQPTGFPDLGAAEIPLSDGTSSLLVESPQSMANHLEAVCLNSEKNNFVDVLKGLSIVKVTGKDNKYVTNSVSEAHRIASFYIIGKNSQIGKKLEELETSYTDGFDIKSTAQLLFKLDINSLIHGMWASHIKDGRIKIPRALSSFIEASNAKSVVSGGVKFDHVKPSRDDTSGAEKGQGNIPFSRIEYTAESITAYFNLDLEQIRNYGLGENQTELLIILALWKIRGFLEKGIRLRTACDLKIKGDLKVVSPDGFELPCMESLDNKIKNLISQSANQMETTTVTHDK